MLEIFDKSRKKLAILENAFDLRETIRINAMNYFEFSLPDSDPKNKYCQQFNLIRYNNGEFYRIVKDSGEETETGYKKYECEHVIALLLDTIIPDFVSIGGLGIHTAAVINYVLDKQNIKHWVLKECDFSRQFEYGWDKENLLTALFSIPNRFVDDYIWVFDTSVYPYQVSLKYFDKNRNPDHYIRKGHNRLKLVRQSDSRYLCTRLYPYGAGEGINQLTIAEVNNNIKYLQSPQEYIEKYGLIERVWIDRRYIDQQSLLEAAQVMLNELQEPYAEYETKMLGNPKIGDVVQIGGGIKSYIVETNTLYDEVPETTIKIANKPQDIAASIADLADRQRIEMSYSQGATQIYADSIADNADESSMLELRFFIPQTVINVNAVECKIRLSQFRAYSTNVNSGGSTTTQTQSGGTTTTQSGGSTTTQTQSGGTTTTQSGGSTTTKTQSGGTTTTQSGGSTTTKTQSGGTTTTAGGGYTTRDIIFLNSNITYPAPGGVEHVHVIDGFRSVQLTINDHTHSISGHTHTVDTSHTHSIATHTHTVNTSHTHGIATHSHTVNTSHTHSINTHSHTVNTAHTHAITPKISFFGNPTSFWLYVNGQQKQFFDSKDAEINITQYLVNDRKIPRGTWHVIGVLPNALARVEISYNITSFIQSRGDMSV